MENDNRNTVYYSTDNLNINFSDCNLSEEIFTENISDEFVHFVLVYKSSETTNEKRIYYEQKIEEDGLVLATEEYDNLNYVKIFAPNEVLCRYCEIMKIRMPIKLIPGLNVEETKSANKIKKAAEYVSNYIDDKFTSYFDKKYKWTAEFSTNKEYLFDITSKSFFPSSVKCLIINFILERAKYSDKPQDIGIARLLNEDIYKAAYPIHDGNLDSSGTQRNFFSKNWANTKKILHYQPLDDIKNYFGVKFALYFAWLGFYTTMLVPAAIVGILCMLYGWWSLNFDSLTHEICNEDDIIMCPQCDKFCDYWKIIDACTYAKVTHLFDNYGTVFFGFFMSVWSALYIEFWKRYSAEISHRWGMTGFDLDAQFPRPEYLAKYSHFKKKKNVVTNQEEPKVPFFKVRLPVMILSFSLALVWILLAVAAVFGVVIYRMAGVTADFLLNDESKTLNSVIISITAGIINLVCITVLNYGYERLAHILTKFEFHRTQVEFDDSLTLKIYMFQFVNFYSSLFYIAFLKGKIMGNPKNYNRIFGFRQEECSLGGCMMELFMQLAIIMIGKQALNNIIEIGVPMMTAKKSCKNPKKESLSVKQWVEDYALLPWDSKGMFYEYLEMVIQYGFVTLFVTAFPLAPVFALINNIFEMRLDANKYLKYYRRPTVQRVKDIGIWFHIIEALGKISVVTNAFVIAFCSNYIPKMVYSTQNYSEMGFLNFSLSYFDVKDFDSRSVPRFSISSKFNNISECRYADYRNPHWYPESTKYHLNLTFWHIFAARLAFVVVYQNVVSVVVMLVQWAIPDIPKKLKDQIKREALRTSEYIIVQETLKVNEEKKRQFMKE